MFPLCSAHYDLMTHSCQPQNTEQQGSSSSRRLHSLLIPKMLWTTLLLMWWFMRVVMWTCGWATVTELEAVQEVTTQLEWINNKHGYNAKSVFYYTSEKQAFNKWTNSPMADFLFLCLFLLTGPSKGSFCKWPVVKEGTGDCVQKQQVALLQ